METVATWFGYNQPTRRQQLYKLRRETETQVRALQREIHTLSMKEKNIKVMMKNAAKRTTIPARRNQGIRDLVDQRDMINDIHKKVASLGNLIASLKSVQSQIVLHEAQEGVASALRMTTEAMKEGNKLSVGQFQAIQLHSSSLAEQLLKAEVIGELVDDTISTAANPEEVDVEDAEVDAILAEILTGPSTGNKLSTTTPLPQVPVIAAEQEEKQQQEEEEEESSRAMMEDMNHRLQALRSV